MAGGGRKGGEGARGEKEARVRAGVGSVRREEATGV